MNKFSFLDWLAMFHQLSSAYVTVPYELRTSTVIHYESCCNRIQLVIENKLIWGSNRNFLRQSQATFFVPFFLPYQLALLWSTHTTFLLKPFPTKINMLRNIQHEILIFPKAADKLPGKDKESVHFCALRVQKIFKLFNTGRTKTDQNKNYTIRFLTRQTTMKFPA